MTPGSTCPRRRTTLTTVSSAGSLINVSAYPTVLKHGLECDVIA